MEQCAGGLSSGRRPLFLVARHGTTNLCPAFAWKRRSAPTTPSSSAAPISRIPDVLPAQCGKSFCRHHRRRLAVSWQKVKSALGSRAHQVLVLPRRRAAQAPGRGGSAGRADDGAAAATAAASWSPSAAASCTDVGGFLAAIFMRGDSGDSNSHHAAGASGRGQWAARPA